MASSGPSPGFIAARGCGPYIGSMIALCIRLTALLALAMMPLSMLSAPAAAESRPSVQDGHCDEHRQPAQAPAEVKMDCANCAGLLSFESVIAPAEVLAAGPRRAAPVSIFSGIELEIATPPPKVA